MAAWTDIEVGHRITHCAENKASILRIVVGIALGVKALVYFFPIILPVRLAHAFTPNYPNVATTAINAMLLMLAVFLVLNCKSRLAAALALVQYGALLMLARGHVLVIDHLIVAVFIVGGLILVPALSARNQSTGNTPPDPGFHFATWRPWHFFRR